MGAGSGELQERRIILWCGNQPCIYAETCIPKSTTAAHPWLAQLGDEPLGEQLLQKTDVSRSDFVFALFPTEQLPAALDELKSEALWARRSDFSIGTDALTVTEVFLPGILDCAS